MGGSDASWNMLTDQTERLDDSESAIMIPDPVNDHELKAVHVRSVDDSLISHIILDLETDAIFDFCSDIATTQDDLVSQILDLASLSDSDELVDPLKSTSDSSSTYTYAVSAFFISLITGVLLTGLSTKLKRQNYKLFN